ncbi:MAG: response regulator transcription factor [Anaerolineae bacterium]
MSKIRVLIADDHPIFRHGIGTLLETAPDMAVVGEATNGEEVVNLAESLAPDVVLMDLQMPVFSGIEATRQIAQCCPFARVLVVTMFEDDSSVFAAMRAGARGYFLKDAAKGEVLRAIRAVHDGELVFGPSIAAKVLTLFNAPHASKGKTEFPDLTEREVEILDLMAQGINNQEIARRLNLTVKTVHNYVSTIFNKLQVADRSEAIVRARRAGLGGGP